MKPEDLLMELLEHFYVSSTGGLEWSYIEGVTIAEAIGSDFEEALLPYLSDEKVEALRQSY